MLNRRNKSYRIAWILCSALLWTGSSQAMLYLWKDSAGVSHYTNKEYEVPQRYRSRVKLLYPEAGDLAPGQQAQGQARPEPTAPPAAATPAAPSPAPATPSRPATPLVQPAPPPTPPAAADQPPRGKSRVDLRRERKLRTYQGGGPGEE